MKQLTNNEELIEFIKTLKDSGRIYNETDFCQKVGIPKSYLSQLKSGTRKMTKQIVSKIMIVFPFSEETPDEANDTELSALISLARENTRRCHDQIDRLITILEQKEGITKPSEKKTAS